MIVRHTPVHAARPSCEGRLHWRAVGSINSREAVLAGTIRRDVSGRQEPALLQVLEDFPRRIRPRSTGEPGPRVRTRPARCRPTREAAAPFGNAASVLGLRSRYQAAAPSASANAAGWYPTGGR